MARNLPKDFIESISRKLMDGSWSRSYFSFGRPKGITDIVHVLNDRKLSDKDKVARIVDIANQRLSLHAADSHYLGTSQAGFYSHIQSNASRYNRSSHANVLNKLQKDPPPPYRSNVAPDNSAPPSYEEAKKDVKASVADMEQKNPDVPPGKNQGSPPAYEEPSPPYVEKRKHDSAAQNYQSWRRLFRR